MPTIADLRQKYPDLAGLDDEQTVDAVHQAFYADLPREQVAASLGVKPPTPPKAKRTMGEAISDTGRSIMSGAAGLVKSGGELYGLATGDMENGATQLGTDAQQYWEDGQSRALHEKRADRKTAIDASPSMLGKFGTAIYETLKDPALLGDVVASNVATLVPGMAVGRAAAAGRMTMAMRAAQGAGPVSMAEQAAIAKGAGTLGTAAAVGAAAVQQGADVSGDTYTDSLKKTAEQLAANPDFVAGVQAKVQAGMDEPSAILATKKELGTTAARAAFLPATAISVAANAIPGGTMLERALVGGAAKNTIKTGGSRLGAMAKAGLGEAAQETIEEGGGAFVGNLAKQRYVDPNQDLADSVGENAGLGFVGGLGMGVPSGALHGHVSPGDEIRAKKLEEVGPLTRGVNAGLEDTAQRVDSGALPVVSADQLILHAQQRLAELDTKANGTKEQKGVGPAGEPIVTPATQGQFLTADEIEERKQLASMKEDPKALARAFGVEIGAPAPEPAPAAPTEPAPAEPAPTESAAPAPPAKAPVSRDAAAQREADRPAEVQGDIQPGDLLNNRGGPFLSMPGAMSALARAGEGHEIVKVTGGLVVRPTQASAPQEAGNVQPPAAPQPPAMPQATAPAQPTTLGGTVAAQPAGTRGTTAADLAGKPIDRLLDEVKQFPSATLADGATEAAPIHEQDPQARTEPQAPTAEARADQAGAAPAVPGEGASLPAARPAAVQADGLTWRGKPISRGVLTTLRGSLAAKVAAHEVEIDRATKGKQSGNGRIVRQLREAAAETRQSLNEVDATLAGVSAEPDRGTPTQVAVKKETAIERRNRLMAERTAGAAPPTAAPAAQRAAPRTRAHPPTIRGSSALAAISNRLGGISPDLLADMSEKRTFTRTSKFGKKVQYTAWDNPPAPGYGPLFRKGGSGDLSEIARVLEEEGFLTPGANVADPIGATQRAQEIVRAELANGGSSVAVGDANAIDAEMTARRDAAMDDPGEPWDSYSFEPDDLEASGYVAADPIVKELTEGLIREADELGLDTERLREDAAHLTSEQSEAAYHAEVQSALRQAVATAREEAGRSDAGATGASGEGRSEPVVAPRAAGSDGQTDRPDFALTAPTAAEVVAEQDRRKTAAAADAAEQKRLADKAQADATRDEFTLTGSDRPADVAAAAGQGDLLADPAAAPKIEASDPLTGDYAAFDGKTFEQKAKVAETGDIAVLRMDAAKTLREFDKREQSLRGLLKCLSSRA